MKDYISFINEDKRHGKLGAGVLPISLNTGRILVAYRGSEVYEPNTWAVWGGKVEDYEHMEEAVRRELCEETGYCDDMELIKIYIYSEKNFTYHNYIGLINDEFIPELNWENEYYKWVNINELLELEPKHFGLEILIKDRLDNIKEYCK